MRPMAVVWPCPLSVEDYARAGRATPAARFGCPGCRGPLRPEGGYWRQLRHRGVRHRLWVHRARCTPCGRSHALLPDFVVAHHLDSADTIAAAVHGRAESTVPVSTVAGWRRRWRANHDDLVVGTGAALVAFSGGGANWSPRRLVAGPGLRGVARRARPRPHVVVAVAAAQRDDRHDVAGPPRELVVGRRRTRPGRCSGSVTSHVAARSPRRSELAVIGNHRPITTVTGRW